MIIEGGDYASFDAESGEITITDLPYGESVVVDLSAMYSINDADAEVYLGRDDFDVTYDSSLNYYLSYRLSYYGNQSAYASSINASASGTVSKPYVTNVTEYDRDQHILMILTPQSSSNAPVSGTFKITQFVIRGTRDSVNIPIADLYTASVSPATVTNSGTATMYQSVTPIVNETHYASLDGYPEQTISKSFTCYVKSSYTAVDEGDGATGYVQKTSQTYSEAGTGEFTSTFTPSVPLHIKDGVITQLEATGSSIPSKANTGSLTVESVYEPHTGTSAVYVHRYIDTYTL